VHFDPPPAGSPAAVLSTLRGLPELDPSDLDALERVIEAGKLPVQGRPEV
jgi:hypothetical protein